MLTGDYRRLFIRLRWTLRRLEIIDDFEHPRVPLKEQFRFAEGFKPHTPCNHPHHD
jgi:hypothetical protein